MGWAVRVMKKLRDWYRSQWRLPFDPLFLPGASWTRFIFYMAGCFFLSLTFLRAINAEDRDRNALGYLLGAVIFGVAWIKQWKRLG
jgi:hypothetical protein